MSVNEWVKSQLSQNNQLPQIKSASCFAPSNIALIKYWGKRDIEFNLPTHSSLSISLADRGADCCITTSYDDQLKINNKIVSNNTLHYARIFSYIELLLPTPRPMLSVNINVNIPIAAGLASSACIFAALCKAIDKLYDWQLDDKQLSRLARIGSGSAARSIYSGFVKWQCGSDPEGEDSYAYALEELWPNLRIGLLITNTETKKHPSTEAMLHTTATSPSFARYSATSETESIHALEQAIKTGSFNDFGSIAEKNAQDMHATMHNAVPPINYNNQKTVSNINKIRQLRQNGLNIYFTQDAGPNIKLIFENNSIADVMRNFPECEVIAPFKSEIDITAHAQT